MQDPLHRTAVRLTSCTHLRRTCCCPTQVIYIPLELILWPLKVLIFLVIYLVTLQAWINIEASYLASIGLVDVIVGFYMELLHLVESVWGVIFYVFAGVQIMMIFSRSLSSKVLQNSFW